MKKYVFRLEQVRNVRRLQEEIAKQAMVTANTETQRAIAYVAERMAYYESANSNVVSGDFATFGRNRLMAELAYESVLVAKDKVQLAEAVAKQKHVEWAEAAKQVKILERLDEKKREEYLVEYNRELDKELDDVVTGRFAHRAAG